MITLKRLFSFSALTMLTALTVSSIAAWYSILGLTAIFAAAVLPIIIMGGALEVAKIISTVWLHTYWSVARWSIKLYLVSAVLILAIITSMGIFGFLSKAHLEQTAEGGNTGLRINQLETRIAREQRKIIDANTVISQLDQSVQTLMDYDRIRGPDGAIAVRQTQSEERSLLNTQIDEATSVITQLQDDLLPLQQKNLAAELKVGPLKYVAALIYGDEPDENSLARAVRYLIVLIVVVFDPLALVLVLAAVSSFKWEAARALPKDTPAIVATPETDTPETDTPETDTPETDTPEDKIEVAHEELVLPKEIQTEGVTYTEVDGGYVLYNDKVAGSSLVHKSALQNLHGELFGLSTDTVEQFNTSFGTQFPKISKVDDVFVRVDMTPNKTYKYNGKKWVEINKESTVAYVYDEAYIQYLISQIEKGAYDIDLLSSDEKRQIEVYLKKTEN